MVELTRTVRFFLNDGAADPPPRHNAFSAWPPPRGLGRFFQLHACCLGPVNPVTGYFFNVTHIDAAIRRHAIPLLQQAADTGGDTSVLPMGSLLQKLVHTLQANLEQSVASIRLDLSPYHHLALRSSDMDHVIITQQYEFSAAHRLHSQHLSDEENRREFGKCNHPSGHGHNYQVEVSLCAPVNEDGHIIAVEAIDQVIDEHIIQYLDHKHLNIDIPEFESINTSVENISEVIYRRIDDPLAALGLKLEAVSVWETPKTKCTYRGEPALTGTPARPSAH